MLKNISLGLGTGTISVAVALIALLVVAGTAFAAGDITVGSDTVDNTGDEASVDVSAAAPDGSGIGNWEFEITYDPADLGTPVCTPIQGGTGCEVNPGGATGIIRVAGSTGIVAGLEGTVVLVSITADAGVDAGECSDLTISLVTSFQDGDGEDFDSPALGAGEICVEAEAEETDAPTDAPTATPASVPQTGGAPGASSANSMAWLLAAAGLTVVAGGAWVLARAGREN